MAANPSRLIRSARAAVADALPKPPTVTALAATLGLDRSTLYRACRAVGTTPSDLVRGVRLSEAAARLEAGAPVGQAGAAAGYFEPAAFSRAFRRSYGVPPSQWGRDARAAP